MPVTFVDGMRAELLFDPPSDRSELGSYGFTSGGLGRIDRDLSWRFDDASQFKETGPLESYLGPNGEAVEVWEAEFFGCPNLVFGFGRARGGEDLPTYPVGGREGRVGSQPGWAGERGRVPDPGGPPPTGPGRNRRARRPGDPPPRPGVRFPLHHPETRTL
jgi:hypothetical protein